MNAWIKSWVILSMNLWIDLKTLQAKLNNETLERA